MKITDLLKMDTIILDLNSSSKAKVIDELVNKLDNAGRLNNKQEYKKDILKREEQSTTGIGDGVAIPHAKSRAVKTPAIAFGRSIKGIDFDSLDGEASHLFFMIAASEGAHSDHLETLSRLSTLLMDTTFRAALLKANSKEEVIRLIDEKEQSKSKDEEVVIKNKGKLLAVTACPTGIAHTYMAADSLKNKAKEMGVDIKVETNGSTGVKNRLTNDEIKNATAIIVSADTKVEMDRFDGKVVIQTPVADAIKKPGELIQRGLDKDGGIYIGDNTSGSNESAKGGKGIYRNLMNGVSNMLPFVVGGGILIALAFLFDFNNAGATDYGSGNDLAQFFMNLGKTAFGFMLPILAGYIALSIGDRPALAPGFVGGALAANGNAGFLGALAAGFIAGYLVLGLKKLFSGLPDSLEGIKPVLLFPLFGILIMGVIMTFAIVPPVEALNTGINNWLSGLGGANKLLLGLLLGGMMAVDMGGPVNKAAYVFGVASVAEGNGHIMAAVMAGGMVPPLGIALATTFFKNKFTVQERDAGKTNYVMGLSFITEGAIPFAAADPKAVIPSIIAGSAIAGGLSAIFGASSPAPHGGIFVFPVVTNWLLYLVAILVGSLVTAILLNIFKKPVESKTI
ncbi:fructose-specific PTS transporter subunit EIIC [Clostridium sp. D2Q-11]|uniref:Fructose-specific PTS transporter subunit EIIC n=1 Tax=Anaeromonas frigoriresistens TaxID=2683708 RepID=A0A942Z8R8_9FIRM|nr:fructose-specific PTS transporter subunit EIIC [Anaeromonas frigoriresistens]MBS4538553.1 fructose-specific PTS transporter subunit EIIC [Anaeromonas frigoriresistens]